MILPLSDNFSILPSSFLNVSENEYCNYRRKTDDIAILLLNGWLDQTSISPWNVIKKINQLLIGIQWTRKGDSSIMCASVFTQNYKVKIEEVKIFESIKQLLLRIISHFYNFLSFAQKIVMHILHSFLIFQCDVFNMCKINLHQGIPFDESKFQWIFVVSHNKQTQSTLDSFTLSLISIRVEHSQWDHVNRIFKAGPMTQLKTLQLSSYQESFQFYNWLMRCRS